VLLAIDLDLPGAILAAAGKPRWAACWPTLAAHAALRPPARTGEPGERLRRLRPHGANVDARRPGILARIAAL
jgi:hypothetical protein